MDNGAHVVLRVARIIAASLPAGVAAFWAVAWVLTNGGAAPYSPEAIDAALAFRIWAVVALAGFAGALYFRGRALAVVESVGRDDRAALVGHAGAVQSNLIIAWALLEAPALFAGVVFLLLGDRHVLLAALPLYLIGLGATYPRAEWFGASS